MAPDSTGVPLLEFLRPGDILIYSSTGIVGWWIKTKTSSDVTHGEWYLGDGKTAASRGPQDTGGGGVNTYDLRTGNLVYLVRPNVPFDLARMRAFHESCCGQGYALWDLVKVFYLHKPGDPTKAQCSEHVARCFRVENGGPGLFNAFYDCDRITPDLLLTTVHGDVYRVKEGLVYGVLAQVLGEGAVG